MICFNHVLSIDPDDYWATYRLGDTWRLLADYPTAIAYYDQALTIRPGDYWATYRLENVVHL